MTYFSKDKLFRLFIVIVGLLLLVTMNEYTWKFLFDKDGTLEDVNRLIFSLFDLFIIAIIILSIYVNSVKDFILNFLLSTGSILILIVVMEILFPKVIYTLPIGLQRFLKQSTIPLAISTKKYTVPKDYTLIVGDSFAEGAGDLYLKQNKWKNGQYSSGHFLHEITTKDFLQIGIGGAGSANGIVIKPLTYLNHYRARIPLTNPKEVLIYYYEGNDLNNNLRYINKYLSIENNLFSDVEIYKHFDTRLNKNFKETAGEKLWFIIFIKNLLYNALNLVANYIYDNSDHLHSGHLKIDLYNNLDSSSIKDYNSSQNKIKLDNVIIDLPDSLQGPAMELTNREILVSLQLFYSSIKYLRSKLGEIPLSVVYIPSVVSCYRFEQSISTQTYHNRKGIYTQKEIDRRSENNRLEILKFCKNNGFNFIDPTSYLQNSGQLIHGPINYSHFNEFGYKMLAEFYHRNSM